MSKRAKKGQSVAVNHHQALQRLCWRERECKFDIPLPNLLEPVYGEIFIDSLNDVEDTKGNPGQSGRLIVTNLRIIWHSHKDAKINISIGLFAAVRLEIRTTESRLRGRTRSLFITARNVIRSKQIRYQFIFTNVVEGSPRLFTTIQAVNKAYDSTRLYREIRVRSSITSDYQLNLLPREHILEALEGVMNISGDTGVLGNLCWTNIRVSWVSQINELHNISLPYCYVDKVSVRDSPYGRIVVLQSVVSVGHPKPYTLGFRIEPPEKMRAPTGTCVQMQTDQYALAIQSALQSYCKAPDFGIRHTETTPVSPSALTVEMEDDDIDIVGDADATGDAFAAYFADTESASDGATKRPPVFSEELGLAVEELRPGVTMKALWSVQ